MRLALLVLVLVVGALATAALAPSKGDARAHLASALPFDAAAGTKIRVVWTVDVPDDKGGRIPFGAQQMFVQLLSATGAASTTAFTNSDAGRNTAEAVVPAGGIGGIRIGLRGTTDIFFPLVNDPFLTPGGVRCDVGAVRATLAAFVRAYNRGDTRRLDRLFSRNRFAWYSAPAPGSRVLPDAANRKTLIPYFRRRHRQATASRSSRTRSATTEPASSHTFSSRCGGRRRISPAGPSRWAEKARSPARRRRWRSLRSASAALKTPFQLSDRPR